MISVGTIIFAVYIMTGVILANFLIELAKSGPEDVFRNEPSWCVIATALLLMFMWPIFALYIIYIIISNAGK